jgi:bifunctional UDP-N-acetylglucosamine pyrophosphorylase/glucosamine-1-phosphate N-acetyltransferase
VSHPPRNAARPSGPLAAIVLAAGKGTRFPGTTPKVLIEVLNLPLLDHVRRAVDALAPDAVAVVVGYGREAVGAWCAKHWPSAKPVVQEPQNGTGHAARVGMAGLPSFEGDVLIVCGDVPQVDAADLAALLDAHRAAKADATVLTGVLAEPGSLGRVVRDASGRFARVVEAKDASAAELSLREFNTGIYAFRARALREAVASLPTANAQREEYLPEALAKLVAAGKKVAAVPARDGAALLGVNTPADLALAHVHIRRRIVGEHLARGVVVPDPESVVIEPDVEIAPGARILPFTVVGHGCRIARDCVVGPFAHLRGGTILEAGVLIGNFVEVKATTMAPGAKAKHLTYLGDAIVGEGTNIGCGTITANFDGKKKHTTTIGPRVRIGSGTVLIAPVTVGEGVVTGANSVIRARHDVPAGAVMVGVPARALAPKGSPVPAREAVPARPASRKPAKKQPKKKRRKA